MVKSEDILEIKKLLSNMGITVERGHSYAKYMLRKSGHVFTFEEHVEAMMLSLLSANRPWYQIEQNILNLRKAFNEYDAEYLITASPNTLISKVCALGCGNRAIARQMEGVARNVKLMKNIDEILGNIDRLATESSPYQASLLLSSGVYKLSGFAQTLALQYLRNVGVDTCKPDVHIRRILARMGLAPYEDCPISNVMDTMEKLGHELDMPITLVNEVIWSFGATGYASICEKNPKCSLCPVEGCPSRRVFYI